MANSYSIQPSFLALESSADAYPAGARNGVVRNGRQGFGFASEEAVETDWLRLCQNLPHFEGTVGIRVGRRRAQTHSEKQTGKT
ncbi:hypothetical protein PSAC2689_180012 [Paraburkholderia sacchari]